ncbi:MAG: universal stress protein [Desulfomonilaceae bacterium]
MSEAILLASLARTEVHTISVEEVPRYPGTIDEIVVQKETRDTVYGPVIAQAQARAKEQGVALKPFVMMGHEVKTIVDFLTQQEYDLLVIGFMGHSALYDRVMGGTCQALVRLAPCPVLVVK